METEIAACRELQQKIDADRGFLKSANALTRLDDIWKGKVYKIISKLRADKSHRAELRSFLTEEIGFFQGLLLRLGVSLPTATNSVDSATTNSRLMLSKAEAEVVKASKEEGPIRQVVAKIHIIIGDLFRYKSNFSVSLLFYAKSTNFYAFSLAYNQMAVVYDQMKDVLLSTHFYVRSCLHSAPFPSSTANLARALIKYDAWVEESSGLNNSEASDIAHSSLSYAKDRNLLTMLNALALWKLFPDDSGRYNAAVDVLVKCFEEFGSDSQMLALALLFLHSYPEMFKKDLAVMARVKAFLNGRGDRRRAADSNPIIPLKSSLLSDIREFTLFRLNGLDLKAETSVSSDTTIIALVSVIRRDYGDPAKVSPKKQQSQSPQPSSILRNSSFASLTQPSQSQPAVVNIALDDDDEDIVLFKGKSSTLSSQAAGSQQEHLLAPKPAVQPKMSLDQSAKHSPIGHERAIRISPPATPTIPSGNYLLFPPMNMLMPSSGGVGSEADEDSMISLGNKISFNPR